MSEIIIKKGLNIPIEGSPISELSKEEKKVKHVGLLGDDYPGMKPTILVKVGDNVKLGQPLFEDKKNPGVFYTSPASGKIKTIHRGDKRVFLSIVIEIAGEDQITFDKFSKGDLVSIDKEKIKDNLIRSGLWTALRNRPYNKAPSINETPNSIFITAMDTNPLAPDMSLIIRGREDDFEKGLKILAKLTEGNIHVCLSPNSPVVVKETNKIKKHIFKGPHPAGLVGTHIHFIDPVGRNKTVWHIGLQDVIAYGKFFTSGRIPIDRVVSLAGTAMTSPKVVKTRLGASVTELMHGEIERSDNSSNHREHRFISGSVLAGKNVTDENVNYLGRYDLSICALKEGRERIFLGMIMPGVDKFSIKNVFLSKLFRGKKFAFTTTTGGSHRAMVPIGSYEAVMPLDIIPTYLLRSIIIGDTDKAIDLGALELAEEDLGLCTFVCPSKYNYGKLLRDLLTTIEKEG